jgi:hypothetical protein
VDLDFYAAPGPFTALTPRQANLLPRSDPEPAELCRLAQGLLVSPFDAEVAGVAAHRMAERDIRPATRLIDRALELDRSAPLDARRALELRVVGTCRHFAVLATAFLRASGIPARARCGFATYFVPPQKVDHWIVEVWSRDDGRWIRIDPEYVDRETPAHARAEDLRPGEFLTAGEAWQRIRSGEDDPAEFGVFGTDNWGAGEVRGNAMRDLASLHRKVEMLPWDEWGPMQASYRDETGADFDVLIDRVAAACAVVDDAELEHCSGQLAVPPSMIV